MFEIGENRTVTYGKLYSALNNKCTCDSLGLCEYCFYKKALMLGQEREEHIISELVPKKFLLA